MPLPIPNSGESKRDFVSRCMKNGKMNKEFPDQKQRVAVCYKQFDQRQESRMIDFREFVKTIVESEKYVVKYAKTKKGQISVETFDDLDSAKDFLESQKKKGYNGIISKNGKPVKEEVEPLDEVAAGSYSAGAPQRITVIRTNDGLFRLSWSKPTTGTSKRFGWDQVDDVSALLSKYSENHVTKALWKKKFRKADEDGEASYAVITGSMMDFLKELKSKRLTESVEPLEEAAEIKTAQELAQELGKIFKKYFPNSGVHSEFQINLTKSISVEFTLGNGKSEYQNGIKHNDPMHTLFFVWMHKGAVDQDGNIVGSLELEKSMGGLDVDEARPGVSKGRVKIPFRKSTGDPSKITKGFERYVKRLKETVDQYKDGIKVPFDISKKL